LQLEDEVDDIICYEKNPTKDNWKIALPKSMMADTAMVADTVQWFHQVMGYPGEKRLCESLRQCYYHPMLCRPIEKLKCQDCQKYKIPGHGYGLLPQGDVHVAPCEEGVIGFIGP
jgi:hypothetical protein